MSWPKSRNPQFLNRRFCNRSRCCGALSLVVWHQFLKLSSLHASGVRLDGPPIHLRDNVGECLSLQVPFGGSCDVMEQGLGCSSRSCARFVHTWLGNVVGGPHQLEEVVGGHHSK